MLIVSAGEVKVLLANAESDVLEAVRGAYVSHARGETCVPPAVFLAPPSWEGNRIIALPASLGGEDRVAGLKWIASFPANIRHGIARASAVIVLNTLETGRPEAIVEGSTISAQRTGASAALAAMELLPPGAERCVGLVGCGAINFEVLRFLRYLWTGTIDVRLYDVDPACAASFRDACLAEHHDLRVELTDGVHAAAQDVPLLSFATTARVPHVADLPTAPDGLVVLNLSLRDLSAELVLQSDNVVDDVEHVCRERTSVHLAEQASGDRSFVRCTIGELLTGSAPPSLGSRKRTIFSPFGLGVLDLGVARLVQRLAQQRGMGLALPAFLPGSDV